MLVTTVILFVVACAVLIGAGTVCVKALSRLASYLHISEFVAGFIVMAFATSIPELFVGISSGIEKTTSLALGNVIGANILNLTLVIGIVILLKQHITVESKKTKVDALYMVFLSALPLILLLIGKQLSRIDGIILLIAFGIYARKLIIERKIFSKEVNNRRRRGEPILYTALFMVSIAALFYSAKYVVHYSIQIADILAMPQMLIGLFLLSFGTTLPELVFGSRAVMTGHSQMALGDMIGSVITNSTLVLGVTAIIFPITFNLSLVLISGVFMLTVAFLFAAFLESGDRLHWKEGVSLILLYVFFMIITFYLHGIVK